MLLDMLTADAAAKHGHEYSPPRPSPSPTSNGSFFAQSPLSILTSVLRSSTAYSVNTPTDDHPKSLVDAPATNNNENLMFAGPDALTTLSPTPSLPASSSSIASDDVKPKKRAHRPKTTYNFAQPPPIAIPRQKLHLRPKVLLQLQQVIPSRRPKPVYEAIPFSLLAPRSTRRLARTFNSKDKLGPNDILVVKAEDYGYKGEDEKSDEERWGARDVMGVICVGKKDEKGGCIKTEVLVDDGSSWEATCMSNGSYEFSYTDEHGLPLKCRWVTKSTHNRRLSIMSNSSQASPNLSSEDKKFNFSTISTNSRRHPVIATMTRASIDVLDSYTMPSATSPPTPGYSSSPLPTPLATPSNIDASSFMDHAPGRLPIKTDDALRRFIVVTGIWVAFSEGWSHAYNLTKAACPLPLSTSGTTVRPPAPGRTASMSFVDSPRSASPASTVDENRRTLPKFIRSSTQILSRKSSFTASPVSSTSSPVSPFKTRPRRSNSTGDADMNRKAGSTKKRFGLAFEDQAVPEAEEERQSKRSVELLRIKELAQPSPDAPVPPVKILEPQSDMFRSPYPTTQDARNLKAQSAYNPITTAGLWDSGVAEGPGLKSRPTSLVVVNEKKEKAKRKKERSKSKEKEKDGRRASERFKQHFIGMFRKEKN
ncbi:hypothetical protein K469DRAFT_335494 [Zopfia rhizophila CBS 207.26]|uniref:Uncharacterized protein n=1 Tax=Zopfia rhizophila CBS 207.26 TaxID=1314779 RepID=A0A6A6DIR9_9PEZI|nr:hypothetical protein K469DRAFT_335494 [Zopfia rhizophila CBS 207.26]